jgi:acetolactate synthase small subunit
LFLVIYEVIDLQMMKQLEVQKHRPNISNFQLKTIQQELVLVQVAKKGHIRKKFISVSGIIMY